jgi:hypothetical protein
VRSRGPGLFFLILIIALSQLMGGNVALASSHPALPTLREGLALPEAGDPTIKLLGWNGWETRAVDVRGNQAYVAIGRQLAVLDVSDPAQPIAVGQEAVTPETSQPTSNAPVITEIIVEGDYAYVMESSGRGLRIVDVSDPAAPDEVGAYDEEGALAVAGDYVYVANDFGLTILNASNPAAPAEVGSDSEGARAIAIAGDYVYLALNSGGLRILDVSDPANPQRVGSYSTSALATDVAVSGSYVYLTEHSGGNLRILDVSNPTAPTQAGLSTVPSQPDDVAVAGSYAYVADGASLYIFNVSNPASPSLAGSRNVTHALNVAVGLGFAYVATGDGLRVVDVRTPSAPQAVGYYRSIVSSRSVRAAGNYVYVVSSHPGLHIVDVSDPARPRQVGFYSMTGLPEQLLLVDGYLYALDGTRIRILDISNPTRPQQTGTHSLGGYMFVEGSYGYLMNGGIHILDLSDPTAPEEVGFYSVSGELKAVDNGLAYVIQNGALRIINVRNRSTPAQASIYSLPASTMAQDVTGVGNFAYLLGGEGMTILNVSDPTAPEEAGFYPLAELGNLFAVEGTLYLHVQGTGSSELHVYDISNPIIPRRVGYNLFPPLLYFSVQDDYIYSGGALGLYALRFEPAPPLAVMLAGFSAHDGDGHVVLTWETVSEQNNVGLIPSMGPGSSEGFTYEWLDHEVEYGNHYYYWLEAVDVNGGTTRYGPATIEFITPTAVTTGALGVKSAAPEWMVGFVLLGMAALAGGVLRRRLVH